MQGLQTQGPRDCYCKLSYNTNVWLGVYAAAATASDRRLSNHNGANFFSSWNKSTLCIFILTYIFLDFLLWMKNYKNVKRGVYLCLIFEMSIWEFFTNLKKKWFRIILDFFFKFELDFYCLCSLQKSISKSNWFFNFLNLIFRNWKKIEWHSIF